MPRTDTAGEASMKGSVEVWEREAMRGTWTK